MSGKQRARPLNNLPSSAEAPGAGVGIILASAPSKTGTISTAIDHAVILGAHYLRHLTITATGSIVPSESGATALYDPTSTASARVQNTGLITGGAGAITVGGAVVDLAGKGSILTNSGTVDGGGAGVVLEAGASLTNSGAIVGGRGM